MLVVIKAKAQIDVTKDRKSWQHKPMAGSNKEYYREGLLCFQIMTPYQVTPRSYLASVPSAMVLDLVLRSPKMINGSINK